MRISQVNFFVDLSTLTDCTPIRIGSVRHRKQSKCESRVRSKYNILIT